MKKKYRYVLIPDHPRSDPNGYVREHILVAEKALGHPLPPAAKVHHHDNSGLNNSNHNLVICENQAYHMLLHARMRALDGCGHANWRCCSICRGWDDPASMYRWTHRKCFNAYLLRRKNGIPSPWKQTGETNG